MKNKKQEVVEAIDATNFGKAEDELENLYGICDRAAQKGAIHKNKASRIKSRVTQKLNDAKEEG